MSFTFFSIAAPTALFAGSLILQEIGRRLGTRHAANVPGGAPAGLGAIESAVFALMGLLLAFTLSGALQRFDARRQLIVDEANAIRTVNLRIDLLPAGAQPALRQRLRDYVTARLELYRAPMDFSRFTEEFSAEGQKRIRAVQGELWRTAVSDCTAHSLPAACTLLLPAMNQLFDVGETRFTIGQRHPPNAIFIMLFGIGLASSLLAGFGMGGGRTRSWLHVVGFAAAVAITLFIITDLEVPRLGLITLGAFDHVLYDALTDIR